MNAVALAAAFRAWPSGMNRDQSTGHHSRSSTQLSPCHHAGANGDQTGCAVWESRSVCVSSVREASLQTSSPTPGTPPPLSHTSCWELQRQCHTPRVVGLRRPQLQRASPRDFTPQLRSRSFLCVEASHCTLRVVFLICLALSLPHLAPTVSRDVLLSRWSPRSLAITLCALTVSNQPLVPTIPISP